MCSLLGGRRLHRRCGAGLGRCQGGFCSPLVHKILAREMGVSMKDVTMDEQGTYIVTGYTKEAEDEQTV